VVGLLGSGAISLTGVGAVLGVAGATVSADQFVTGIEEMIANEHLKSGIENVAIAAGASEEQAAWIDTGAGFIGPSIATNAVRITANASRVATKLEKLQELAKQAIKSAKCAGCVRGIDAHKKFADAIRALKDPHLRAEVSYMRDAQGRLKEVPYGTKDAIRLDAVEYTDDGAIKKVYDLKTGDDTLRQSRKDEISNTLGVSKDDIMSIDEKDLFK